MLVRLELQRFFLMNRPFICNPSHLIFGNGQKAIGFDESVEINIGERKFNPRFITAYPS